MLLFRISKIEIQWGFKFITLAYLLLFVDLSAGQIYNWDTLPKNKRAKMKNIPIETLKGMNSSQLVEACVNSRYSFFLFAYNSLEDGFARFQNEFNGI